MTTSAAAPLRGLVFFAHGSRDPRWSLPIETVAHALRARHPDALCTCAYLELTTPDLPTAVEQLYAQGCLHVTVLPMFLGMGRHAREDLPKLVAHLRMQHPNLHIDIATPVGEDARVQHLLAELAHQHLA